MHSRDSGSYPYHTRLGRLDTTSAGNSTTRRAGEDFETRAQRYETTRLAQERHTEAVRQEQRVQASGELVRQGRRGLLADHGMVQPPSESNVPGEYGYPVSGAPICWPSKKVACSLHGLSMVGWFSKECSHPCRGTLLTAAGARLW